MDKLRCLPNSSYSRVLAVQVGEGFGGWGVEESKGRKGEEKRLVHYSQNLDILSFAREYPYLPLRVLVGRVGD